MQKIIKQDLGGSEKQADKEARYTWQKNEIAWYFCTNYHDLFEVKFTGNHWLSGNKWRRDKIYQYKYLSSTGDHDLNRMGLNNDGISHHDEDDFFTNRSEALVQGNRYLKRVFKDATKKYNDDMLRLNPTFKLNNKLKKVKEIKT